MSEEQACPCPEAYPDWDGQDIDLSGWCVHDMPIKAFFHMPIAYDMYVAKQAENVEQLGLKERWPGLVLTRTKMFGGHIMRLVEDSESPSRLVRYLPPPFDVSVFLHHGGIGSVSKAVHEHQIKLVESGRRPKELYLAHLTCPVCEQRKGGDKILVLRRWVASRRMAANARPKEAGAAAREKNDDN